MKREIENIVLLGSGNVATHLGLALKKSGLQVRQIYSRSDEHAKQLGNTLNTAYCTDLIHVNNNADLYIISVTDSAVDEIVSHPALQNKFLVHTAGSISADVFTGKTNDFGVLYPFQTFSKSRNIDFSQVPVLIEGNTEANTTLLIKMARKLTPHVVKADSKKRALLHISAVFACNFTNHMYAIAKALLTKSDLSFDLMKPLITETAEKVMNHDPVQAQTGPAVRFDANIVSKHNNDLKDHPDFQEIYNLLSKSIQNMQK